MAYEGMIAETVSIPGDKGEAISAYLARPLGAGPFPGILLIHHAPGWDEWYRETTRKFAHHGYAALSPNYYHRAGAGNKTHADAAVATLSQIVSRIVMRRFGRPVGDEASLGQSDGAKFRQQARQTGGPDVDFVAICGGAVVQLEPDLARRKTRPVSSVNRNDIIGADARGYRQQRGSDHPAKAKPMRW